MKRATQPTRGERNNNPLNIRFSPSFRYEGQIGKDADGFATFKSLLYGVRAAFALLRAYSRVHGIDRVQDIIARFAPPNENATEQYIDDVCRNLHVSRCYVIDYHSEEARSMVKIMARIESRMDLPEEIVSQAQKMVM